MDKSHLHYHIDNNDEEIPSGISIRIPKVIASKKLLSIFDLSGRIS